MNQDPLPVQPRTLRFWLDALIVAWAFDLLFWDQTFGMGFPVWIGVGIAGFYAAAIWEKKRPAWGSHLLAVVAAGFSLVSGLRSEPFTRFLCSMIAVGSLGLLAVTLTTANWTHYRLGDYLIAGLKLFAAGLVRGAGSLAKAPRPPEDVPAAPSNWQTFRKRGFPLIRGISLAIPVLVVLGSLLASADPVFARMMTNLFKVFSFDRLPEFIFRAFYILIFTYLFAGILLNAIFPEPAEKRPDPNEAWKMRFLGSVEALVVLGSVVLLFAVFLAIQMRYLFGGQANITETGYTFSEYARRGFFELVTVAVLSLMLYLGLGAVTRRETPAHQRSFTILSCALIIFVLVILVSALQRLLLYEDAYGFTRLRTYTHIFIPWLAALLVAAIVLEVLRRPGRFGLALLLFTFGFGLTFAAINVDGLIANLDLQRSRRGAELDGSHLVSLSSDAVPALARAYLDPSQPVQVRGTLGAVLACKRLAPPYRTDWRSYNLSQAAADRILRSLDLSTYLTGLPEHAAYVNLDGGQFDCYGRGED